MNHFATCVANVTEHNGGSYKAYTHLKRLKTAALDVWCKLTREMIYTQALFSLATVGSANWGFLYVANSNTSNYQCPPSFDPLWNTAIFDALQIRYYITTKTELTCMRTFPQADQRSRQLLLRKKPQSGGGSTERFDSQMWIFYDLLRAVRPLQREDGGSSHSTALFRSPSSLTKGNNLLSVLWSWADGLTLASESGRETINHLCWLAEWGTPVITSVHSAAGVQSATLNSAAHTHTLCLLTLEAFRMITAFTSHQ